MRDFFKKLFNKWTCCHEWREFDRYNVLDDFGGRYTKVFLVCKRCGKIKKYKSN